MVWELLSGMEASTIRWMYAFKRLTGGAHGNALLRSPYRRRIRPSSSRLRELGACLAPSDPAQWVIF